MIGLSIDSDLSFRQTHASPQIFAERSSCFHVYLPIVRGVIDMVFGDTFQRAVTDHFRKEAPSASRHVFAPESFFFFSVLFV